jgi:hypothetical protein
MNDRRAALYLQIPAAYCRTFGGFRWAHYGEAVEFLDGPDAGRTFAFAPEIAQFLEGLLSGGESTIAFGCVLHLLYIVGLGDRASGKDPNHRAGRIAGPFRDLNSPLRNAGALCAWLCRDIRGVADPPELPAILRILNGGGWIPEMVRTHPMLGAMDYAEQPGLEPAEFDARLERELDTMSDDAIRHWLKHGRGPVESIGDRLAPLPSRDLSGTLAELERRPRLAGAMLLVSRLEGALSLPPRRLDRAAMRTDGYSDLATRGSPEQILPIQFALEDEEFVRRFAGRELLYFHREVPRQPAAEELVLLLDQGVRTWGEIRLVLAGAAMALARQSSRRRVAMRLATTGNGGEAVDPARLEGAELADLLEASDLSPNPGRMLARLLRAHAGARRDVVLLTHPRNLGEAEVMDAARLATGDAGTRLLAVSVDSGGQVELAELRGGWPVVLGRSRVELGVLSNPRTSAAPAAGRGPGRPWRGDLEPIPFPFRCGILDGVSTLNGPQCHLVDFDQAGERILIAGRHSLLTTCRLDGDEAEILPRPLIDGEVLRPVSVVIGVAGGFVVAGNWKGRPVLAHYDFPTRTCTLHRVGVDATTVSWFYIADSHVIAGLPEHADPPCIAIDLGAPEDGARSTSRARRVVDCFRETGMFPVGDWARGPGGSSIDRGGRDVRLDAATGTLEYRWGLTKLHSLIPLSDGSPALKGARIASARQGRGVLAIRLQWPHHADVVFISRDCAAVLGTFSLGAAQPPADSSFALSRDGRRFTLRLNDHQVEVRDVPGDRPPVVVTPREDVWIHFASLGRSCLLVREFDPGGPRRPQSMCLIRWDRGRLEVDYQDPAQTFQGLGGVVAESRGLPPSSRRAFDPDDPLRFSQVVDHVGLQIFIDQYNHLAVLDRDGDLIGMFYVAGSEFAAWMPDGTRLGSSRLIGGASTPHAAERLARVLRSAEMGQGGAP